MAEDLYAVLGVSKDATEGEIQKAYRKLAAKFHPDLADDKEKAKEQFVKVQHAYDVLTDEKKKTLYDQYGPAYEEMGNRGGNPFGQGQMPDGMQVDLEQMFGRGGGGGGGGGFEEILQSVFGGAGGPRGGGGPRGAGGQGFPGGGRPQLTKGQNVEQSITIPFAIAVLGGKHQLSVQKANGKVEDITITIPIGIQHGKKIRLRGQGTTGHPSMPPGDLMVKVLVAPHPSYRRSGNNLQISVPVSMFEATLGAKIQIPTPHGQVTLSVPAGTSSGKVLRMKGLGIEPAQQPPGDLLAEIQIVVPEQLDEAQREQFEKLQQEFEESPRHAFCW